MTVWRLDLTIFCGRARCSRWRRAARRQTTEPEWGSIHRRRNVTIQFRELDVVSKSQRLFIAVRVVKVLLSNVSIGFTDLNVIVQECDGSTCPNGEHSIQEENAVKQEGIGQ